MSLDLNAVSAEADSEFEIERPIAETVVTVAGTMLAVLFASWMAVVMYLA